MTLPRAISRFAIRCSAYLLITSQVAVGATLPAHAPMDILIVADEVNPHRLEAAQLTQPEDLAPALTAADSGLHIGRMETVNSQCLDTALDWLQAADAPDVVLYFAHRGAHACDGSDVQPAFTDLIAAALAQGTSLVVLHHGLYVDFTNRGVKQALLNLIGAQSDSIAWNTTEGQRVINVSGGHFIASNGLDYEGEHRFAGGAGIADGVYPAFTNVPDELYEITTLNVTDGEMRTPLFVSDSGTPRTLGYVLQRPGWRGRVVAYQPGEYQPAALDDRSGNNFQILANALWYAVYGDQD